MQRSEAIQQYYDAVDAAHQAFVGLPDDIKLGLLHKWDKSGDRTLVSSYLQSWRDAAVAEQAAAEAAFAVAAELAANVSAELGAAVEDKIINERPEPQPMPEVGQTWISREPIRGALPITIVECGWNEDGTQSWVRFDTADGRRYSKSTQNFLEQYMLEMSE